MPASSSNPITSKRDRVAVVHSRTLANQQQRHLAAATERAPSRSLSRTEQALVSGKTTEHQLTRLPACVPDVVSFNVGGEVFSVTRTLIEKDPQSLLFVLATRRFTPNGAAVHENIAAEGSSPRERRRRLEDVSSPQDFAQDKVTRPEGQPISIPDKDPIIFREILNVVRGYKHAISDYLWREACIGDVNFYGLQKSWNAVIPPQEVQTFTVKSSPTHISSSAVSGLAGSYYTTGEHVVTFVIALQGGERVATGVEVKESKGSAESTALAAQDESYNRALYWNDGNVTTYFTAAHSFSSGFPFKASMIVRVFLDADEGTVRWAVRGYDCVAMTRLPKCAGGYAFCAVSTKGARIDVVNIG